jgi:hypothetical protein
MGHYDSCYESDEKEKVQRENEIVNDELRYKIYSLNLDEKKFVLLIIENLDTIKSFAALIKKL